MFYILSHIVSSLLTFSDDLLRILTGKKHPKTKLQRLQKKQISTFGSLVHQINTF